MTTQIDTPVEERISAVLKHLGIERAHFASRNLNDWYGMAARFSDAVASLTLVCPLGFDSGVLATLGERLLVFNADRGGATDTINRNMAGLPSASMATLADYAYANNYADIAAERGGDLPGPILDFLARIDAGDGPAAISPPSQEGEIDGVFYKVAGSGPPLVLLPLGAAPVQWTPSSTRSAPGIAWSPSPALRWEWWPAWNPGAAPPATSRLLEVSSPLPQYSRAKAFSRSVAAPACCAVGWPGRPPTPTPSSAWT